MAKRKLDPAKAKQIISEMDRKAKEEEQKQIAAYFSEFINRPTNRPIKDAIRKYGIDNPKVKEDIITQLQAERDPDFDWINRTESADPATVDQSIYNAIEKHYRELLGNKVPWQWYSRLPLDTPGV